MSKLLDKFKAFVESEEFTSFLDKINFMDSLYSKYINKFSSFSLEKQNKIIDKIINKYESNEYKNKEISKGRVPENYLYHILYLYASSHCPDVDDKYSDLPFFVGAFQINKKYEIVKHMGQGTLYKVYKL